MSCEYSRSTKMSAEYIENDYKQGVEVSALTLSSDWRRF